MRILSRKVLALAAAAIAGMVLTGSVAALAQQKSKTRAEIAAKVHSLKGLELKKIIASDLYGEKDERAAEGVRLHFVAIDDVVVAGKSYALIFVDADDVIPWRDYKPYLPWHVHEAPASVRTDEQVLAYLQKLTADAEQKFSKLEAEAYEANKKKFSKRYPGQSEETIRASARRSYEGDDNGKIAPEAQRAYNEYAAVGDLANAMSFYIKFKTKL